MSARTTYIFAGGGTGGHLYPALAIWQELRDLRANAAAHFLCSSRPVDRSVLEPEGVTFTPLPAQYPSIKPRQLWRFLSNWPASVRLARQTIRDARAHGPVQMVTLGGFVAAPAVQAARVERVPVTLVNIDAIPGKANRWIAARAGDAFTAVASADFPRWTLVPPVVRREARIARDRAACRAALSIAPDARVLLITGGSLGARSLNDLLAAIVADATLRAKLTGWHILHQTGTDAEADRLTAIYRDAGIPATVAGLTRDLPTWWHAADLALSRAGAGAVAEAWASQTPTLFAPYPYHKDQHQKFNAQALVAAGAAALATDSVAVTSNLQGDLGQTLLRLLQDGQAREAMSNSAKLLGPADGASRIAAKLALLGQ